MRLTLRRYTGGNILLQNPSCYYIISSIFALKECLLAVLFHSSLCTIFCSVSYIHKSARPHGLIQQVSTDLSGHCQWFNKNYALLGQNAGTDTEWGKNLNVDEQPSGTHRILLQWMRNCWNWTHMVYWHHQGYPQLWRCNFPALHLWLF